MIENLKQEKLEYSNTLLKEFNDIIELAEQSTKTIDDLNLHIEQNRVYLYGSGVALAILSAVLFSSMLNIVGNYISRSYFLYPIPIISAIISSFCLMFTINFTYSRISLLNRFKNELYTEKEIHRRLLSLIDEQKRRVQNTRVISPVSMATFDMKIMRLSRGN